MATECKLKHLIKLALVCYNQRADPHCGFIMKSMLLFIFCVCILMLFASNCDWLIKQVG